jgi:hypothetical protein
MIFHEKGIFMLLLREKWIYKLNPQRKPIQTSLLVRLSLTTNYSSFRSSLRHPSLPSFLALFNLLPAPEPPGTSKCWRTPRFHHPRLLFAEWRYSANDIALFSE